MKESHNSKDKRKPTKRRWTCFMQRTLSSCSREHASQPKSDLLWQGLVAQILNFCCKCSRLMFSRFSQTLCNARQFVNGPWIATLCEMTITGVETEWEGACKRLWVATLLFPSLVQCSLLRRYHDLEHFLMPFTWTLLSGAKRHPQINGQQVTVSSKSYRRSWYSYHISYLRIVNKIKWADLIF